MARRAAIDKRIDWDTYVTSAEVQPLTSTITNVSDPDFFSRIILLISAAPPSSDNMRYRLVSLLFLLFRVLPSPCSS